VPDARGPAPSTPPSLADGPEDHRTPPVLRALQEPDLVGLYADTLLECAASAAHGSPDQPGWLEAEVNREYDQIRAAALDDTLLYSNAEFEQAVADLRAFAQNRSAAVRAQVAAARASR